jgi:hypothetical protein
VRLTLGAAFACLIVAIVLVVLRRYSLDHLPPQVQSEPAAAAVFDTLLNFPKVSLRTAIVLGVLIALGACPVGPGRLPRAVRGTSDRTADSAARWAYGHHVRTGRVGSEITDFHRIRRDLALAVDPELFLEMEGSTDSEMMFCLALTFGLEQDPPSAVARMAGLVERTGCEHGVKSPLHMTVAVTDGQQIGAFRYSTAAASGSLYYSTQVETLRALHTDVAFLRDVSDETRLIVSEPLSDLPGVWNEVPETTYSALMRGSDGLFPFPFIPQLV